MATFKRPTVLCCELVEGVVERQIPGTFAFESDFPNAPICTPLAQHARASGGDLQCTRKVWVQGTERRAEERAAQIPVGDRKPVTRGERTQWYFTKKIWLPEYPPAVRVGSLWAHWKGTEPGKILIPNHMHWDVTRVLRGYGQRWTGTETLHRDGKQHWGLGECPLRSGEGQTRPLSLVLRVPSQGRVRAGAHETLTTIGAACRAVRRETLGKTLTWASERATWEGWQPERIKTHLALT